MKQCLCGYEGNQDIYKPHVFRVERIAPDWPIQAANHIWFYIECDNCGKHTKWSRSISEAEILWDKNEIRGEDEP